MVTITVDELQHDVLHFMQLVEAGETLLIIQAGAPVAELRPIVREIEAPRRLHPVGLCAGEFTVPGDFDAPLPADLLDAFEGR
jgi:antitoxin (DNA-binding transcriptional repressor) of toxin-antitoxin stability system